MSPLYERSTSAYKFLTEEVSEKESSQKDSNASDESRIDNLPESILHRFTFCFNTFVIDTLIAFTATTFFYTFVLTFD